MRLWQLEGVEPLLIFPGDVSRFVAKAVRDATVRIRMNNQLGPRAKNLLGQRFGALLVVEYAGLNKHQSATWKVRCDCGAARVVSTNELRSGGMKSCGCAKEKQRIDIGGKRFGRLVVGRLTDKRVGGHRMWECRCDCGKECLAASYVLRQGIKRSCGCLAVDGMRAMVTDHGLSHTPEYNNWSAMMARCCNENNVSYHNYGGRGIKVCDRWHESFENFLADMGHRQDGKHTIDRIDVNGDYEPGNCRWASMSEQALNSRHNRMVLINGEELPITHAIARFSTVNYGVVYARMRHGWPAEKAILAPSEAASRGGAE